MSDYIPKDPLTPNPNDRPGYDRYGNARFEPALDDSGGKGPYILLGLLVAIGLIGGMLYFNGGSHTSPDVAQARNPTVEHVPAPATPAAPGAPALTPTTPAPATPADRTPPAATPR